MSTRISIKNAFFVKFNLITILYINFIISKIQNAKSRLAYNKEKKQNKKTAFQKLEDDRFNNTEINTVYLSLTAKPLTITVTFCVEPFESDFVDERTNKIVSAFNSLAFSIN